MASLKKKHDPAAIFLIGDQYHNASQFLAVATKGGVAHDFRMPAIVCAAFALELFFKCLVTTETGKTPGIHDLRQLFNALNKNTQNRIRDRFAPYLSDAQRRVGESATKSQVPIPNVNF